MTIFEKKLFDIRQFIMGQKIFILLQLDACHIISTHGNRFLSFATRNFIYLGFAQRGNSV